MTMNFTLILFLPIVAALLAVLTWALRGPRPSSTQKLDLECLEQTGRRHATYLPLIHQALSPMDLGFLASHGSSALLRRVRKERRGVTLAYLAALHDDFQRLLRLAQVVALLSPDVGAAQEFERARLSVQFSLRYQMLRAGLYAGLLSLPRLDALSHMVSELAARMEMALKELGERAALAAKAASSLDRRGVDIA
jgi:hypothetical protein